MISLPRWEFSFRSKIILLLAILISLSPLIFTFFWVFFRPLADQRQIPRVEQPTPTPAPGDILNKLIVRIGLIDFQTEKDSANIEVGKAVRAKIVNELTSAQQAYQEGRTKDWQKALEGAEIEFTRWDGPGEETPPSKEQWEKYGSKWARITGVTPLYQPAYFELVKLMKSLGYWVDETGKDGWR